ncbi:hypothetical protein HMPREF1406_01147 [Helicobacter pylori GAM239Bi]|nr:hypothetical protein HMPREF1406_01147 [Helicobacter pylori GAM239Bi]
MISVQKVGYSIFFIIKNHLNKFKFCLLVLLKRLPNSISHKNTPI